MRRRLETLGRWPDAWDMPSHRNARRWELLEGGEERAPAGVTGGRRGTRAGRSYWREERNVRRQELLEGGERRLEEGRRWEEERGPAAPTLARAQIGQPDGVQMKCSPVT
jgi:hypothetical protein